MTFRNVLRNTMVVAITANFTIQQIPSSAMAMSVGLPTSSSSAQEDNVVRTNLNIPSATQNPGSSTTPGSTTQTKPPKAVTTNNNLRMGTAKVPEAYSCPLFDNRPHAELLAAIDSLNKEVKSSPECTGNPSAKAIEDNGNAIKDSVAFLQAFMNNPDAAAANPGQVDQTMTAALSAVGNLGDIVNNNNFLNSKCGRQTMSTGKVLLALNDVINGIAPFALLAVSMSAAMAPALPFVLGGVVATSGISAITKMIEQNTLDMSNAEHRKAVLQNTCQFTKVARKVRFMQLAQSGKIDRITQELEQSVDLYNAKFSNPSRELSALLKYRDTAMKINSTIADQLRNDTADLNMIENQIAQNSDDLMVCTLANELVNWAQDGRTFPASVFNNLERATEQGDRTQKLQATSMRTLHTNSMQRVAHYAAIAYESRENLAYCAQAGRSWFNGARQASLMTSAVVAKSNSDLESELTRNTEYRQWSAQFRRIEQEKLTIKRVEKAMQELAKDNSIIDRSELAQRMTNLKSGLFGSRSSWSFGKPPVLAWIEHTKKMHDQSVSAFLTGMREVRRGSYSLTPAGRGLHYKMTPTGYPYVDHKVQEESQKISQSLSNINLRELPVGSREHEIMCQNLESAWLDWAAAIDHVGAIQFFCDMIDPVLDAKMDTSVMHSCRGNTQLNGSTYIKSTVDQSKDTLIRKGYQAEATLISQKMKSLQCPVPAISVMND